MGRGRTSIWIFIIGTPWDATLPSECCVINPFFKQLFQSVVDSVSRRFNGRENGKTLLSLFASLWVFFFNIYSSYLWLPWNSSSTFLLVLFLVLNCMGISICFDAHYLANIVNRVKSCLSQHKCTLRFGCRGLDDCRGGKVWNMEQALCLRWGSHHQGRLYCLKCGSKVSTERWLLIYNMTS